MNQTGIEVTNIFTETLLGDKEAKNFVRQVFESCYSEVDPKKPLKPEMVHFNQSLAEDLNLGDADSNEMLSLLSGDKNFEGFTPYAMCYGGHQFGHWAGQLGDGRAINIAEVNGKSGAQTIQLKGAGVTPYSRGADGLAVLRSSIREYLCSEAMFHLGVPTTRALSLVLTGDSVVRDVLYNGNPALEKGAIVARVSPTFLRFGNFEIYASRQDIRSLKLLTDFTVENYFPHLGAPSKETYLKFFAEIVETTMNLMLEWERVGFVHGVMNTDNMSILGLTIDYGPYGWLEDYDINWTPNTTDAQHRRYRFGNQGRIGVWNLVQLANALFPLIEDVESLENILKDSHAEFDQKRLEQIVAKTGIVIFTEESEKLALDLEDLLQRSEIDMTLFYRNLNKFDPEKPDGLLDLVADVSYSEDFRSFEMDWKNWFAEYVRLLKLEDRQAPERVEAMNRINPKYVLRNYMAQLAIDRADDGDYRLVAELFELLQNPYDEKPGSERWFVKRPDWAKNRVGCSMLSCSS
jgi:serine/tyrosine/threonine adenylyltransferase